MTVLSKWLRVVGFVAVSVMMASCASSHSKTPSGDGIPIMILGEDSDPSSISRSSDIFRRVINELKQQMSRYNFYVIDEEMMAAEFGWKVRDRRPKSELIQVVGFGNRSGNRSYQVRALVIFKIRAIPKDLGFATKAFVLIAGEIYDAEARRFIDNFEAKMDFPIIGELTEEVGDRARDIAAAVGDALRKKLAFVSEG